MVMKANHYPILFSEILVDVTLRALQDETVGTKPLPITLPQIPSSTPAERVALIRRLVPKMQEMCERWQAVPMGDTLLVVWPDRPRRHSSSADKTSRQKETRVHRPLSYRK
jgi:hypothetical protein